jgi:hypothetical protein
MSDNFHRHHWTQLGVWATGVIVYIYTQDFDSSVSNWRDCIRQLRIFGQNKVRLLIKKINPKWLPPDWHETLCFSAEVGEQNNTPTKRVLSGNWPSYLQDKYTQQHSEGLSLRRQSLVRKRKTQPSLERSVDAFDSMVLLSFWTYLVACWGLKMFVSPTAIWWDCIYMVYSNLKFTLLFSYSKYLYFFSGVV